jgi:PAS domain S-box-containing protein
MRRFLGDLRSKPIAQTGAPRASDDSRSSHLAPVYLLALVYLGDVVKANTLEVDGMLTERRLAAIVESSEDAIISKDLNGIITSWNSGTNRLFGYEAEEIVGKPVTLLIPPERLREEEGILARIRRGERIEHYETIRRRKDGNLVDISPNRFADQRRGGPNYRRFQDCPRHH